MRPRQITLLLVLMTFALHAIAQTSFVKVRLPSPGLVVTFEPKPYYASNDSAVYSGVEDNLTLHLTVKDTNGKHKELKFEFTIEPYSINTIIITGQGKKKIKFGSATTSYYLPALRCKHSTPLATVERSIVDLMLIDHIGARLEETKKFIRQHCLTYRQVKGLVMMFPSDKDRLSLAKYSFFYVRDYYNYFLLKDAFNNKSIYKEFEEFVKNINRSFKF